MTLYKVFVDGSRTSETLADAKLFYPPEDYLSVEIDGSYEVFYDPVEYDKERQHWVLGKCFFGDVWVVHVNRCEFEWPE